MPTRAPVRLLVVVPAWNEEATLPGVLAEVRLALPGADVLVVDDGSSDATTAVARRAGVAVATLPVNLGVGAALRTGFRHALRAGYDVLVQVDADGQHDPAQVPALLAGLEAGADLVVGARGRDDRAAPGIGPRRWAMVVLSVVLSRVAHTRLTDTTSGFRAFNARAVELFAASFPAEYLGDTVEALVVAARGGLVVREVPVSMRPRLGGEASTGPWRSTVFLGRALTALGFALTRPRSRPAAPPPELVDLLPTPSSTPAPAATPVTPSTPATPVTPTSPTTPTTPTTPTSPTTPRRATR